MFKNVSPHFRAVFQALFVTFLWSTSWVLIKIGLQDLPPLTFAGLRYSLAFLCLLPFALRSANRAPLRRLSGRGWMRLAALGLLFYAVTQGTQFLGLAILPSVTVSLLLNFTTAAVALMAPGAAGAQTKLLRFPDIHGDQVTFSYAGDIWVAAATGGTATRLTTHPGQELFPKFHRQPST